MACYKFRFSKLNHNPIYFILFTRYLWLSFSSKQKFMKKTPSLLIALAQNPQSKVHTKIIQEPTIIFPKRIEDTKRIFSNREGSNNAFYWGYCLCENVVRICLYHEKNNEDPYIIFEDRPSGHNTILDCWTPEEVVEKLIGVTEARLLFAEVSTLKEHITLAHFSLPINTQLELAAWKNSKIILKALFIRAFLCCTLVSIKTPAVASRYWYQWRWMGCIWTCRLRHYRGFRRYHGHQVGSAMRRYCWS